MAKQIQDSAYWIRRHEEKGASLASVGQKNYSDKANYYMYKQVIMRYNIVLDRLIPLSPLGRGQGEGRQPIKILDAGGGRGIFLDLFLQRKYQVTLVDISPAAVAKVKAAYGDKVCAYAADLTEIPQDKRYDIVHCFDVLYHILDDDKWAEVLKLFSKIAVRYIILHERFLKKTPYIMSKHVKFRPYNMTLEKLQSLGFKEVDSVSTHFWDCRLPTYKISAFMPRFFYQLDRLSLSLLDNIGLTHWGSYHIKVFEKTKI